MPNTEQTGDSAVSSVTLHTEARDKRQGFPQIVLLRDAMWNREFENRESLESYITVGQSPGRYNSLSSLRMHM